MPRGSHARKRRSAHRAGGHATGVGKARGATILTAAVSETDEALEQAIDVLADDQAEDDPSECAGCGHMADMHEGGDGECAADDCSCMAFKPEGGENAHAPDVYDELTAGLKLKPEQGAILRLRLAKLTLLADAALPAEHQPGETLPDPNPSPAAPSLPTLDGQVHWVAEFVPEGYETDDGRAMAPGAIDWRDLPLTLMAMVETGEGGHIGAEIAGRIDNIWRDDSYPGVSSMIRGSGVFESTEYAEMIAGLVENKSLRGVSVDLAIHEYEVGPRSDYFDDAGNWAPRDKSDDAQEEEPDILDLLFGEEDGIFVVTKAVIGMVTVCPFAAFANTKIEIANSIVAAGSPAVLTVTHSAAFAVAVKPVPSGPHSVDALSAAGGTDLYRRIAEKFDLQAEQLVQFVSETMEPKEAECLECGDAITAAAAGLAPVKPPAEWFENPALDELTALSITDDGRIYGHAWSWDVCHTAFQETCILAPRTVTDYAYFHLGEVECDNGARVACGKITLNTGHAGQRLGRVDASAHYDHTGTVVADIRVYEDEFGGVVAGALRPDISEETARTLRAAALSGDWRKVQTSALGGNLELIALLAVNVPGFPVPRAPKVLVAGGQVQSLTAAGLHMGLPDREALSEEQQGRLDELVARATARRDATADEFAALAQRARGEE